MDGLDIVYTDASKVPQGVLGGTTVDLAFGEENTFEIVAPARYRLETGAFVCVNGTEYGGIVDELASKGDTGTFTWRGRTFHGMLATKVVRPDAGLSHWSVSGDANACIGAVLSRVGLDDVMAASPEASGIAVAAYQFDRYCNAYSGICKMLSRVGARLAVSWEDGVPVLSAVTVRTISLDTDRHPIGITDVRRPVNHLVCLGMGELEERTVIDLYADGAGNVSHAQTFFGHEEVCQVYDYPNAEDDELLENGADLLRQHQRTSSVDLALDALGDVAAVGDVITAFDPQTGATVTSEVVKKIVRTEGLRLDVTYETGEAVKAHGPNVGASGHEQGTGFGAVVVQSLPAEGDGGKVYLVPNGGTGQNAHDEYVYVGGAWERLGPADADLSGYAPKASPTFTGTPRAPTAASGTSSTQIATTAFVGAAVAAVAAPTIPATWPVSKGGTGASTAAAARTNLGVTRENLGGVRPVTLFSGLSIAPGGVVGTNAGFTGYRLFMVVLANGNYLLGWGTGSTLLAVGGRDGSGGGGTGFSSARFTYTSAGRVTYTGGGDHTVSASTWTHASRNVTGIYGLI